jgi:hypothetical protein
MFSVQFRDLVACRTGFSKLSFFEGHRSPAGVPSPRCDISFPQKISQLPLWISSYKFLVTFFPDEPVSLCVASEEGLQIPLAETETTESRTLVQVGKQWDRDGSKSRGASTSDGFCRFVFPIVKTVQERLVLRGNRLSDHFLLRCE